MCRRVECRQCGKPTFAGCGAHVEQVLGDVPRAERCRCHEKPEEASGAEKPAQPRGFLDKLFGK